MGAKFVHTSIGVIDTDNQIDGFICGEEPGVTLGKEIIIKTCKTRVIITYEDGTEKVMEPLATESCMNPEIKTVMPLTIRAIYKEDKLWSMVYISSQYETVQVDLDNGNVTINTAEYVPVLPGKNCNHCENCGRC